MTELLLKPLVDRPGNLTDMVLETLQLAITEKELTPGQNISEAALAEALQVSKTPVREALLRLRHIGLVEPAERGLRVTLPSASNIRYAYELRAGLERSTAALAGERASGQDIQNIADTANESLACARSGDAEGFRRYDRRFHTLVAEAARNPMLEQAVLDAVALTRALRERDVPASGDSVLCGEEHLAVSQALTARDGAAAGRTMHAHVQHVMSIVLAALAITEVPQS